jgi:hypothetical protein
MGARTQAIVTAAGAAEANFEHFAQVAQQGEVL